MQNLNTSAPAKWKSIANRHRIARFWRDGFVPRLSIFLQLMLIVVAVGVLIWLISLIISLLSAFS
ncbi:MAG: hypothetical protein GX650_06980 [Clostridiales bacterium]|jgi:uncharacterized membrane protein|nr:hypothetical protein [Clostridiales bacterium]